MNSNNAIVVTTVSFNNVSLSLSVIHQSDLYGTVFMSRDGVADMTSGNMVADSFPFAERNDWEVDRVLLVQLFSSMFNLTMDERLGLQAELERRNAEHAYFTDSESHYETRLGTFTTRIGVHRKDGQIAAFTTYIHNAKRNESASHTFDVSKGPINYDVDVSTNTDFLSVMGNYIDDIVDETEKSVERDLASENVTLH